MGTLAPWLLLAPPRRDPGRLPPGAAGRADHRARVRHGDARLDRHQRRPAPHRRGPRHRHGRPPVDHQRLHAHARRADPPRRALGTGTGGGAFLVGVVRSPPPRCSADRAERGRPHSPPGRSRASAGRFSRRGPRAIQAGFHPDDRARAVGLWSARRGRGGRRTVRGRVARRRARMAVGVPAESAARRDLRARRAPPRTGVAGSGGARPLRRAGGRPRGPGAGRGDVRADRGPRSRAHRRS